MRRINKSISRITAPIRRMTNSLRVMSKVSGLSLVRKGFSRVGSAISGVSSQVGALTAKFAILGAVVGAAVFKIVNGFAQSGDSVAKTARKLGIGVEALQEIRFAVDRAGVSQDKFDKALGQLIKRIGEARGNTGAMVTTLKKLDPTLLKNVTSAKTTEEAFAMMIKSLDEIEDPMQRAAIANAAFGRSGIDMINLAKEGEEGLAGLRKEARHLGLVMSAEAAEAAEKFVDAQTNLTAATMGLRNTIGAQLLPHFQRLVEYLTEFATKHRHAIAKFAEEFAAKLPDRLARLRDGFSKLIAKMQPLRDMASSLSERFGAANVVIGALTLLIGLPLLSAIATLIGAFFNLGVAIMTTPIGWIAAGIALVVYAGVQLVKNWDKIKSALRRLVFYIAERVAAVMEVVLNFVDVIGFVFSTIFDVITSPFIAAFDYVADLMPDWMKEKFGMDINVGGKSGTSLDIAQQGPQLMTSSVVHDFQRQFHQMTAAPAAAAVKVSFENLPQGARVESEGNNGVDLDVDMGYSMGGF